ncbi:MAG: hypothetical protein WC310_04480 [Patescibacteria group bacterium]|jgi:hypothetical protein
MTKKRQKNSGLYGFLTLLTFSVIVSAWYQMPKTLPNVVILATSLGLFTTLNAMLWTEKEFIKNINLRKISEVISLTLVSGVMLNCVFLNHEKPWMAAINLIIITLSIYGIVKKIPKIVHPPLT